MKRLFLALIALCFLIGYAPLEGKSGSSKSSSNPVYVSGHTRKDGTYVAPHYRSAPNSTKADNWSTKGNVNPYTGKAGTKPAGTDNSTASSVGSSASQGSTRAADTVKQSQAQDAAQKVGIEQIRVGMTQAEVKTALGEPNLKTKTRWVYSGKGTVSFGADGGCSGVIKN